MRAFLTTGTWDQLRDNLKDVARIANVLVVSNIDCRGIKALGCGTIGQEPLIVGQWAGLDSMLWLHERGHNVNLPHSAEPPADETNTAPDVAFRFMFWQLGSGHVGKTECECAQFEQSKLPSISSNSATTPNSSLVSASAKCSLREASSQNDSRFSIAQNSDSSSSPRGVPFLGDQKRSDKDASTKSILTEAASQVVERPWVDRAPLLKIKGLNQIDVDSIRTLLRGNPSQGWPQAIQTLGFVGNADDVSVIQRALDFPIPEDRTANTIVQTRILIQTKMAAPQALGVLANRTRSAVAVKILAGTADLSNAQKLVGEGTLATSLSKNAIKGLSIADDPAGNFFVNVTTNSKLPIDGLKEGEIVKNASRVKVAPLEPAEKEALGISQKTVRDFGIEAIFK